jgi:hypothetical protein
VREAANVLSRTVEPQSRMRGRIFYENNQQKYANRSVKNIIGKLVYDPVCCSQLELFLINFQKASMILPHLGLKSVVPPVDKKG